LDFDQGRASFSISTRKNMYRTIANARHKFFEIIVVIVFVVGGFGTVHSAANAFPARPIANNTINVTVDGASA